MIAYGRLTFERKTSYTFYMPKKSRKPAKKPIQYGGVETIFIAAIAVTMVAATGNLVRKIVDSDYFADNRAMMQDTEVFAGQVVEEEPKIKALTDDERKKKSYGFFLRVEKREYLKGCREDISKSNPNLRLPIMLKCYRGELTLDLEDLRKERAFLDKLPGTSDEAKSQVDESIVPLMDAITAVIDGIDAGVYTSEAGLVETKKNLAERYKAPYWLAITTLRANGLLSWTSHMIRRIDLVMVGTEDTDEDGLKNTRGCYEDSELMLLEIPFMVEYSEAQDRLQRAVEMVGSCIG